MRQQFAAAVLIAEIVIVVCGVTYLVYIIGFIFLNQFSHYYVFLYHFVCVIVCVLFLFMLHPCVLN